MQPIAEWLVKIGLERYAPAFADNDIDVSVLPHLTDADLEKIGVSLASSKDVGCRCRAFQFRPSTSAIHADKVKARRRRRAPPSSGEVLGPRGFDGAVGAHGP